MDTNKKDRLKPIIKNTETECKNEAEYRKLIREQKNRKETQK